MPGFIKTVSLDAQFNGSIVSAKVYRNLKEALMKKLRFSVVRAQGMGDVLMSAVVVRGLKNLYPDCETTFYAYPQYLPLLKRFDFIDALGTLEDIDTSAIMVDLMGKVDYLPLCNKAHRLDLLADEAAVPRDLLDYSFVLTLTDEEQVWLPRYLKRLRMKRNDKLIGIHLKSYAPIRTWDYNYVLARLLLDKYPSSYKIILFEKDQQDIPKDLRCSRVIDATGKLSVSQLVPAVSACNILVCPDSGLMHVAGMMRVPFISLFGPIDPDMRIRYYPTGEAIWMKNEVSCAPCWDWQVSACTREDESRLCMRSITPEIVVERIERRLGDVVTSRAGAQ